MAACLEWAAWVARGRVDRKGPHMPSLTVTKLHPSLGARVEGVDLSQPLDALMLAARRLDLVVPAASVTDIASFWQAAISAWARRFM